MSTNNVVDIKKERTQQMVDDCFESELYVVRMKAPDHYYFTVKALNQDDAIQKVESHCYDNIIDIDRVHLESTGDVAVMDDKDYTGINDYGEVLYGGIGKLLGPEGKDLIEYFENK